MEERRQQQVPGNIVSVDLDPEHPLSFGQPPRIFGFIGSAKIFELSGGVSDVGVLQEEDPVVSGFISDENQQALAGGVWLVEQGVGRGRVVLFCRRSTVSIVLAGNRRPVPEWITAAGRRILKIHFRSRLRRSIGQMRTEFPDLRRIDDPTRAESAGLLGWITPSPRKW